MVREQLFVKGQQASCSAGRGRGEGGGGGGALRDRSLITERRGYKTTERERGGGVW